DTYAGFVKGYYIRDKGRDPDVDYDRQFLPLKQHHRGEGNLFHRQQLSQKLRLETEITWISDRNLRQEFTESVFKEGKEAESYVYGRYAADNIGVTMLERYRGNEFQTQTEYLPSTNLYIINREIKLTRSVPLYFSSFTEGSNIRIRYDEQLKQGALRSWRVDSVNEFITRLSVKPFNVTPFWSARYTSYEKCIAGDKFLDRFVASYGVRISSQFYKKYGLVDQNVAKVSLIRLASFDLRYTNNYQVTTAPSSILDFDISNQVDTTDQIEKFEEFYFELRNRFVKQEQEVMNIGAAVEYYPKSYRDTTSQNLNNYLYPFSWIVLAPDDQAKYERRRFSNINMDATWRPRNIVTLYFDTEYNTYNKSTEMFGASLGFNPYAGWSVSLSERYVKNIANAVGVSLMCVPIEKWQLGISDQYDFEQDRFTNRVYTIRRDLHELFLEFTIWADKGKDEIVYNVTLTPKGLFKQSARLRSH
ncbi:LPS assembly protein LptD, partial [Planctomycetota bacterium]